MIPPVVPDTVQLREAVGAYEKVDGGERVVDGGDDERVSHLLGQLICL